MHIYIKHSKHNKMHKHDKESDTYPLNGSLTTTIASEASTGNRLTQRVICL